MVLPLIGGVAAAALAFVLFSFAAGDPRTRLPRTWRLPVALVAGVLATGGGAAVGSWNIPLASVLAAFGSVLAAVDARSELLPNAILLRFLALTAPLLVVAAAATGQWAALLGALAGAAALFAVYFLLTLAAPAGLGMGDVKLAAVLGLYGGWAGMAAWTVTLLGGFLLGGLAGVLVLMTRRGSRGSTFPFGPGMLAAAFAGFALFA